MSKKRVHILTAVNAANVSKSGSTYTIRDVCGAVDAIVMNGMLYPADQLAAGVATLNGKPAPAGHPKDAEGRFISAANGDALLSSYVGSVCRNARHTGGRTLVDIVVNEAQARAMPEGRAIVERLDAAISGANVEPIHVSTGLFCEPVQANGESGGQRYDRIATRIQYDHLAILLNERGAGTPEQGVGMFLNAAGQPEEVEAVVVNTDPADRRSAGIKAWVLRLLGNSSTELSFDAIQSGLYSTLGEGAWLQEVYDRYAIWRDRDGTYWRQDYSVSSDGSVAWSGTATKVRREVTYEPVTNHEDEDSMKNQIVAALNAAGIKTDGLDDTQLLSAYNALVAKPHQEALVAANSKIAGFEAERTAAQNAERDALATELAVNSSLTVDDLKALPLARLKELKAKAAPVVVAGGGSQNKPGDEFAGYSVNVHFEEKA